MPPTRGHVVVLALALTTAALLPLASAVAVRRSPPLRMMASPQPPPTQSPATRGEGLERLREGLESGTGPTSSTRISLKRLGDLQRLDANGDGVVSVGECEIALFGPMTPLDDIVRLRTYFIIALVPVVAIVAYDALPGFVDIVSTDVIRKLTPQSRELSRTLLTSVLLPTNSLLFGTLVSTTISRQWERQRRLREELNTELQMVEDLVHNLRMLLSVAPTKLMGALSEVRGYLISLLCECSWRCTDAERFTFGEDQRTHTWRLHEIIFEAANGDLASKLSSPVLVNQLTTTDALVTSLNTVRARRRSSREGEFPRIHWALLTALGSSVLGAFLTECAGALDESFAEALKVRVAFSFMCSFFTALTALMADLSDPFSGEYRVDVVISGPVRALRICLKEAVALRRAELSKPSTPPKPSNLSFEPRKLTLRERLQNGLRQVQRPFAKRRTPAAPSVRSVKDKG